MNPLRAWNVFWFGPVSARPLAAFRVVMGLLALAQVAFLSVDLDYWLTDRGILQGTEARVLAGPLRPSPLQWVQDPASVRACHIFNPFDIHLGETCSHAELFKQRRMPADRFLRFHASGDFGDIFNNRLRLISNGEVSAGARQHRLEFCD